MSFRGTLCRAALALLVGLGAAPVEAEVGAGTRWVRVAAVELDWERPAGERGRRLEAEILRRFGVQPFSLQDTTSIDLALARLRALPEVSAADVDYAWLDADSVRVVVRVLTGPSAAARSGLAERLTLRSDDRGFLKARVGLKGAVAMSAEQWFGNGDTLTEFNPRGRFDGGRGPNGVLDLAPSAGFAGALPLGAGPDPAWVYASALYLAGASVGQDNNRNDGRFASAWEEAFVGITDGGVTRRGSVWRANLSYGRQPYCIGNGMLICQIAASGGDRAADFAWPRWSGQDFLKAQVRINQTLIEGFRFEPNDAPSTGTTLAGINLEQGISPRIQLGGTWLTARDGDLRYFRPDGSFFLRDGLKVWQMRGHWRPEPGRPGPIVKAEYARQTHADEDMRATGWSLEGGYSFAEASWQPQLSYRRSETTGDDPATPRYERWDLLYSGGDIDTWVQGQLMKNIHYNSNVEVDRLLVRASPGGGWRWTGAVSSFRADTRNNLGGVISELGGRDLGQELLLVADRHYSRHVYLRLTTAALWPGDGVRAVLPDPVRKPWLVAIAQINVAF
jgi:hypothetical protein